jgi:subtilisin family serine protease
MSPVKRCSSALLLLAALSLPAFPGERGSEPAKARSDAFVARLAEGHGMRVDASGRPLPFGRDELIHYSRFLALDPDANPPVLKVWMKLDRSARPLVEALGAKLRGSVGDLASAQVPLPALAGMLRVPGVEWVQAVRLASPELEVSVPEIGASQAATQFGAQGAGAIVGLVDSGIDITHGDFRNPDNTTRIKAYWNQADASCPAGITAPPGFTGGCYYTEANINSALTGSGTVDGPNADGHGTHVAAIAAGDGSQTGNGQPANVFVGVAPRSDIIAVKATPEAGQSCPNCDLGAALTFIDQRAAALGKPYVVNISLGYDDGGHDGSDPVEQVIDTLTGAGIPGKAVVKSAGNNRGLGIHASGTVANGTQVDRTFTIPAYTPLAGNFNDIQLVALYYNAGDNVTVSLFGPSFPGCASCTASATTGAGFVGFGTPDGVIILDGTGSPSPTGSRFFEIELDDQLGIAPNDGVWTLRVRGNSITQGGRFDMWIWFSSFGASGLFSDWNLPDFTRLLTIPGTSQDVTTAGAYVTKTDWTDIDGDLIEYSPTPTIGELGDFSGPGPTRDGRIKPEITAPGQGIGSALSATAAPAVLADANDRLLVLPDGVHWVLAGTSMSAPHVTGVYAQMLGLNPGLDSAQLRMLVQSTARIDAFTGFALPDNDWGSGKLDALAAVGALVKDIPTLTASVSGTMFTWTGIPAATTYNVYRGDVDLLDGTFFGTCFQSNLPSATFTDVTNPAPRKANFYLVTGKKDGIEGLLGFQSSGAVRRNTSPCP